MRARLWKWIKRLLMLGVVGTLLVTLIGVGAYFYYSRDLPSVEELRTWRPPQVTKVQCKDGSVCAEFYLQRRTWVDITTLPKHVRDSFLAAEDADFYSHQGLDYLGILTRLAESDPAMKKQLDDSCRRVLRLKDRMGLLDGL